MTFKTIIFDLDGTLVDTLPGIAAAANRVLQKAGFPTHDTDRYRDFIGDGLSAMVKRALPPEVDDTAIVARVIEDTAKAYDRTWAAASIPYPGISDLLERSIGSGLMLAVLSNKPDKPAREMVAAFFPRDIFSLVIGAASHTPPKPDPSGALGIAESLGVKPNDCFFLGDMAVDMNTARAAGMFPLGALWGYQSAEELLGAGAAALMRTPADLAAFFK